MQACQFQNRRDDQASASRRRAVSLTTGLSQSALMQAGLQLACLRQAALQC